MSLESSSRDIAGFVVMAGGMTALACYTVPGARALSPARRATAAAVAFLTVVVVHSSGLLRVLHEDVSNRIGGEFDETSTWLVVLAGAMVATICCRAAVGMRRVRKRA